MPENLSVQIDPELHAALHHKCQTMNVPVLDKGVVRRFVEGLGNNARNARLTDEQRDALAILELPPDNALFISDETLNLLMTRRLPRGIISIITSRIKRFVPLRYQGR